MCCVPAEPGIISKTALAAPNPFNRAAKISWLLVLLLSIVGPCSSQSLNITQYPATSPQFIVAGPDGALWFTEWTAQMAPKVARITTSGGITEYAVSIQPYGITKGPDGALWFAEAGIGGISKIGRITTSGMIAEYPLPNNAYPYAITLGPDGALWFTEGASPSKVGRISTAGAVTEYAIPTVIGEPASIATGSDGALWFTEGIGNKIGRITTTGEFGEYAIPTANSSPTSLTNGPDGALWFTERGANKIGQITTSGAITEYATSSSYSPWGIAAATDGSLWFTEGVGSLGRIGQITMSGIVTEYSPSVTSPQCITVGPDGALWFVGSNMIGRVQLSSGRSGVLSHIAAGGGWTTVITLVNNSSAALPVTVALHNEDGSALSLPVTTTLQGVSQTYTTSSVDATINPKATLLISTGDGIASTSVGWADVLSSGSLGGFAIFRQTPQSGSPSEGTVPLQTQFRSTITLPYDDTAGFVMGVALANLSTTSANITATVWDDGGNQLGVQNIATAGSGHTSFVLPTEIPITAGMGGIVQFQSGASGGLAGLGLRFSPFGTFTSVPTM